MDAEQRHDDVVFLFSSLTGAPGSFFQGYAHVGHDLVVGQRGADAYLDATGEHVQPGEDGCYVTVAPTADGPLVGVDHAGLMKLFVWRGDGRWCVSNSLARLRDHVARDLGAGWLQPSWAQVGALGIPGASVTEQLSHPETILEDVWLVPLGMACLITDGGPVGVRARSHPSTGDYDEDLGAFLHAWQSRIATLIHDDRVGLVTDLSGGLDSRVVFALAGSAAGGGELDEAMTFVSGKGAAQRADLAVATDIAHRYGMTLNRKPRAVVRPYDPAESFTAWHDLNVGLYLPIYRPRNRLSPWHVNLSGLGGENHRPFYPQLPPREFVDSFRATGTPEAAERWRSRTQRLLDGWAAEGHDPLVRLYREFRGRIHGGMFAQTKINAMPFASHLMEPLAVAGRRVYFDIMANTLPDLLDIPFDRPEKTMTRVERRALRVVDTLPEARPGVVYAFDEAAPTVHPGEGSFVDRLWTLAEESATSAGARDLLGDARIEATLAAARAAKDAGTIARPRQLNDVSRLITAAWALAPSGPERMADSWP